MVVEDSRTLDEPPQVARQFSDYAAHLENESLVVALEIQRDGEAGGEQPGRTCGIPGWRRDPDTARNFARILQEMIRATFAKSDRPSGMAFLSRIRIFEDRTIPFNMGDGVSATLTDCRSTQFRRLRAASGISEADYSESLCSKPFLDKSGQGGKSGALFLRSHDGKYILKTIEEHEFACLKEILPSYVLYLEENRDSLLCRFYGAYAMTVGGVTLRVVVMANVLDGPQAQIYDLKGTTEDRWVDPAKFSVLKDNNFKDYTLVFDDQYAQQLRQRLKDDAEFLEAHGLMDYSLLVGVAAPEAASSASTGASRGWLHSVASPQVPSTFYLGIIDYLQRWTPKKVAAHWLKKYTIGCTHEIDTEPPTVYCARFYKYFFTKVVKRSEI